jgi:hypothetical protein
MDRGDGTAAMRLRGDAHKEHLVLEHNSDDVSNEPLDAFILIFFIVVSFFLYVYVHKEHLVLEHNSDDCSGFSSMLFFCFCFWSRVLILNEWTFSPLRALNNAHSRHSVTFLLTFPRRTRPIGGGRATLATTTATPSALRWTFRN